ncbi:MAG: molybdopterin molybdotransferase MoeA [Nevskia sp.]|nr:molybdopterin molybdotransferase MoeA [Nevskia sp.]
MIPLGEALAAYAKHLRALPAERIPLTDALGRVLAEPLAAACDLPRFDQSAMDGYALRAADVAAARADAPLRLPIALTLTAGAQRGRPSLPTGCAARILTGAGLPQGADTVIPQEKARREGDVLVFDAPWPARRNIRWQGEELRAGSPLADRGQRITPGLLAALVNGGITSLAAVRRPRLRVLVTGDEVRPVGSVLEPGEIPDSNGPLIRSLLARWGHAAPAVEYLPDRERELCAALARALDESDLVITSGGASVGDRDYLPATAETLGVRRVFWQVAQKPGKPLYFGMRGATALFALPGNPGAVLIGMLLHVRRALDLLEGVTDPQPHWSSGVLAQNAARDTRRDCLLRMRLHWEDGTAQLIPLPGQDSHMLGNLARADALVWLPRGEAPAAAGSVLRWLPLPE